MFQAQPIAASEPRRGVILMIVLILLTLFAIVGLSFALYADAEAKSAQIYKESEIEIRPNVDPEELLSYFMGQLLCDTDNQNGVYSALRGHSLARSIFGYNDTPTFTNLVPFNGPGRIHATTNPLGIDDYLLVNYTYFPGDNFIHDPERMGVRANPSAPYGPTNAYFGVNVPYTYPDLNNMFLAAVKPDGTVLIPSFHRPWLFGAIDPTSQPPPVGTNPNPNWTNAAGKYMILRPRPADMGPGFPYPEDGGGDVKNLIGSPGTLIPGTNPPQYYNNDSIWIDLGFPVMQAPNGKKFKPLFAPLIIDLDSKVNLNVHGNIVGLTRGGSQAHVSNQSWGPWTVNLGQVMNATANPTEWTNLFVKPTWTGPTIYGRYGPDTIPSSIPPGGNNVLPPFYPPGALPSPPPHFYSLIDYDGCNNMGGATLPLNPIGAASTFSCFPWSPTGAPGTYDTSTGGYGNGSVAELTNHPGVYNFFQPSGDDRAFPLSNMEALLRYGQTGSPFLTSELLRLCPSNFLGLDPTIRNRVTLRSFDFDVPGVVPWIWNPSATPYTLQPYSGNPLINYPQGAPVSYPTPPPSPPNPVATTAPTEFGPDWRALTAALGRLDLNRPLPDYPLPQANGLIQPSDYGNFMAAQTARQQLAGSIFNILLQTTTSLNPTTLNTLTVGSPAYNAARWLAQLAVNIVDFIDTDDYMTPFFWNPQIPTEVVFGTELPRVVVNEAYAQFTPVPKANPIPVQVWVELLNTFNPDSTLVPPPGANGGDVALATQAQPVYQIVLCQPDPGPNTPPTYYRRPDNVWGTAYAINPTGVPPDQKTVYPVTQPSVPGGSPGQILQPGDAGAATWAAAGTQVVIPASGGGAGPGGYYFVGPGQLGTGGPIPPFASPTMQYQAPANLTTDNAPPPPPTVLLQRLACPYRPLDPNPTVVIGGQTVPNPNYNPFITVDYMQNVDGDPTTPSPGLIYNSATTNNASNANPDGTGNYHGQSDGRNQPYYGYSALVGGLKQVQTSPPGKQPQNTFLAVNSQAAGNPGPFNWLVHLDRQLSSPMELLHVSAFKPHELTQEFVDPLNTAVLPFGHRVPWFDEDLATAATPASHRLYRFFEFVTTRSRSLSLPAPATTSTTPVPAPAIPGQPTTVIVTPAQMSGLAASGVPWSIQPGSVLVVQSLDPTGSFLVARENIVVQSVTATTFTANFYTGPYPSPNPPGQTTFTIALTSTGDRVPGKININTIWEDPTDPRTFSALCDAQASNNFTGPPSSPWPPTGTYDVTQIYNQLLSLRGSLNGSDTPFWGAATGLYPTGDAQYANPAGTGPGYSINNTLLRSVSAGSTMRLFEVPFGNTNATTTTPYVKYQLLNKIFNNITTRSNVFAVWVTVGFFEVVQDTDPVTGLPVRPVKLGAEIGRAENRNIRHRMFAIVDRTGLTVPSQITTLLTPVMSSGLKTPQVGTVSAMIQGANGQFPWIIKGLTQVTDPRLATVVIDSGNANQETVTVTFATGGPPATITANFTKAHAVGASVSVPIVPGNPGPQPRFSVHDPLYAPVVPYFSIIN